MTQPPAGSVYDQIGEAGFGDLVRRFYALVRTDDLIGPMYPPDDWEGSERRLRMFLVQRFGGPGTYSAERGHPRLRMRHVPFAIDEAAAERWFNLMDRALHDAVAARTVTAAAAGELRPFFAQTAVFMINRAPGASA